MLSPAGNWAAFEGSICWMGQVAPRLLFLGLHMGGSCRRGRRVLVMAMGDGDG